MWQMPALSWIFPYQGETSINARVFKAYHCTLIYRYLRNFRKSMKRYETSRDEPKREDVTFCRSHQPCSKILVKGAWQSSFYLAQLNRNPNHALKNHSHHAQIWKSCELIHSSLCLSVNQIKTGYRKPGYEEETPEPDGLAKDSQNGACEQAYRSEYSS